MLVNSRVTSINPSIRNVQFENGEHLNYDALLLATGARAVPPDLPGIDHQGVVTFDSLDDTKRILKLSRRAVQAVVIGGANMAGDRVVFRNTVPSNVSLLAGTPVTIIGSVGSGEIVVMPSASSGATARAGSCASIPVPWKQSVRILTYSRWFDRRYRNFISQDYRS